MTSKTHTILVVFIHGFKGDHTTFAGFPSHLARLVQHRLSSPSSDAEPSDTAAQPGAGTEDPLQDASSKDSTATAADSSGQSSADASPETPRIIPLIYPPFETRGDLAATVTRFRAWLLEKTIDAEVAMGTENPTMHPGVGVVIVGHSMGGIVGAEAVLEGWEEVAGHGVEELQERGKGDEDAEAEDIKNHERTGERKKQDVDEKMEGLTYQVDTGGAGSGPGLGPQDDDEVAVAEKQKREGAKQDKEEADEAFGKAERREQETEPRAGTASPTEEAIKVVRGRMFPLVLGLLAFDTPFLGISPGVIRYGAEEQWQQGKAWYDGATGLFSAANWAKDKNGTKSNAPPQPSTGTPWSTWAKYAAVGAGAAATAAGAAYVGRSHLNSGFNWVSEHLVFVGCLARGEDMRKRFARLAALAPLPLGEAQRSADVDTTAYAAPYESVKKEGAEKAAGVEQAAMQVREARDRVGLAIVYTALSKDKVGMGSTDRTFVNLPRKERGWERFWMPGFNPKAGNEVQAHVCMFGPNENPNYDEMSETASRLVTDWIPRDWRGGSINDSH